MSAHRYWRINVASTAGTYVSFAEVELRLTTGGADQAGSGTASASTYLGGYPPSAAVDDDNSTFWATFPAAAPQWWAYDFGSGVTRDIAEIALTSRPGGFYAETPSDFDIDFSDDGSTWTTQRTITGASWSSGSQEQVFDVRTLVYALDVLMAAPAVHLHMAAGSGAVLASSGGGAGDSAHGWTY